MNTNVNYYLSAFDKEGKRLASYILNEKNDKKEIKEKSEKLKDIDGIVTIEVISAEDYVSYLNGKIRDPETEKPMAPPEPIITDEEKKAVKANKISGKYAKEIEALKDAMVTASLAGDTELTEDLRNEYKELMDKYSNELEEIK